MRNHPAINYYKSGLPIVIAGDDPGSFGYNELTFDYYLAFMAWDLNFFDLKEIANNSIRFSIAPSAVKLKGFTKFAHLWHTFVNSTFDIACQKLQMSSDQVQATNVYPSYGPNDASILITVYGNGFENILCQEIYCYFDSVKTHGYLNKLNEIGCETPLGFKNNQTASISIGFKSTVIQTSLKFRFISSKLIYIRYDNDLLSLEKIKSLGVYCCHTELFYLIVFICLFTIYKLSKKAKKNDDNMLKN